MKIELAKKEIIHFIGIGGIGMFVVSIFVTLFVRLSHSRRKKEIRMDTF